ncbi:MAG TPA: glycosyltransferase family 2 protein [Acidimicrobiales bacterium]|nr:glycosyltransferase family 2 protein [Acidimicrobiales bacterium]
MDSEQDTQQLRVSVIVRCLNEGAHIGRLLDGLLEQTRQPDEIIVVDSGSTDDTLEVAGRYPTKIVHITPEEFSFGRALNLGCEAAVGDILVSVSAHVYPIYDSWLRELVAPFASDEVSLTYGRQQGDERTTISEQRIFTQWFPIESEQRQSHPFCNNANSAVRREVWQRYRWDESLTGLEDLALARRCLEDGGTIAYVATAPIVHVHEETWAKVRNRYRREAIAHKAIYDEQRMGRFEAIGLALANIGGDLAFAAKHRALVRNVGSIIGFRTAQFMGSYQGFAQSGPVHAELKRRFYYPAGRIGKREEPGGPDARRIEYGGDA